MRKINSLIVVFFVIFFTSNSFCEDEVAVDGEQTDQEQISQQGPVQEQNIKEEVPLKIKDVSDANKASVVTILALNKITAKSYFYNIQIGKGVKFERLLIEPLFCWKSSPEDVSENKALLKIIETKVDKTDSVIFYGWMFSSSPSVSPMEHPMYDITVVDCK